jgi:PleD family two-component response regulator
MHEFRERDTGYTIARYIQDCVAGQTRGFFVLVTGVTELKNTKKELDILATTDALAGIGNRRCFLDQAKGEF